MLNSVLNRNAAFLQHNTLHFKIELLHQVIHMTWEKKTTSSKHIPLEQEYVSKSKPF